MYAHCVADLLELALHTSIGGMAAHHSQGDVDVQDALHRKMHKALRDFGIDPEIPSDKDLLDCAAWLRANNPPPMYTSPDRLREIYGRAATWLEGRDYGPIRCAVGNDIVEAVSLNTRSLNERFDALTTVVQAIPAQTITDWEWNKNPEGKKGAVGLLRQLALGSPEPRRVGQMHPDAPPPAYLTVNLESPVLNDLTSRHRAREKGQEHPAPTNPAARQDLVRDYQESAAASGGRLAHFFQEQADDIRKGKR